MEDFSYAWLYQESIEELKRKVEYVTYELEITRKVTNDEIMKNNENIKKLVQLLQITRKEKDEALSELKELQQNLSFQQFSPNTPLLSNNNNCLPRQCHVSSPVLIDSLTYNHLIKEDSLSPDSNDINFCRTLSQNCASSTIEALDKATLTINSLAKGRPLPKQGTLLQAVVKAGPLLQTLLIAGPLPQWKNPPGSLARHGPPKFMMGQTNGQFVKEFIKDPFYGQTNGGPMGVSPKSMSDFGSGSFGDSCLIGRCFDDPSSKR